MAIPDADLHARYSDAIAFLRSPSNEGLSGIVAAALVIWGAYAEQTPRAEIETLILGNSPSLYLRKRYERGMALARYWKKDGVPDGVRAGSFEQARKGALVWLASKGVTSQDELGLLNPTVSALTNLQKKPADQIERIAFDLAAALRNAERSDLYFYEAADFAKAIISELPFHHAQDFCAAAAQALKDRASSITDEGLS